MSFTTTEGKALLSSPQVEDLFVRPVLETSIPGRVCTVIRTSSQVVEVPVMSSKATTTWVSELQEIPISAPAYDTIQVVPRKTAGLVPLSSEVDEDSRLVIDDLIGDQLVEATTNGLNSAFLTKQPAPAPTGLGHITPTLVKAGPDAFKSFTAFVAAASDAIDKRTPITAWLMSPATRTKLLTLTPAVTSAAGPYLESQGARVTEVRRLEGGEIIGTSHIPEGEVWGIPRNRAIMVVRRDVRIETSSEALWSRDGLSVRSTMRVGYAFPDESAIIRITTEA